MGFPSSVPGTDAQRRMRGDLVSKCNGEFFFLYKGNFNCKTSSQKVGVFVLRTPKDFSTCCPISPYVASISLLVQFRLWNSSRPELSNDQSQVRLPRDQLQNRLHRGANGPLESAMTDEAPSAEHNSSETTPPQILGTQFLKTLQLPSTLCTKSTSPRSCILVLSSATSML